MDAESTVQPANRPAEILMRRETRVAYGPVPRPPVDGPPGEPRWFMEGDSFTMRAEGEHYFRYRKGEGITIERGPGADISEEFLWLNGSVYAAVASMNGLLPVHASAVAAGDRVFAFTGPPGAGKSTLIAALARRGLPMFCDDTLVLDLSEPDRIICLPGHKRLKLTPEAIELTGAERQEKVSEMTDKYYAIPAAGDVGTSLPLAQLLFLETGPEPEITPILGSERFVRLQDDHQTAHLFAAARRFDRAGHFAHLSRLARQIEMARFVRPLDRSRFEEGVDLAARHIADWISRGRT